ncbi:Subtilisin-like protease [Quillaja saponaria]|uniref:Subtilisin-like protease n=1 Tax=Quillaja saponaria TaxID=32244 RepID=A0AAD7PEY9_QUISA|nr:Subtilisin-like protease [Quillaja saponaria]
MVNKKSALSPKVTVLLSIMLLSSAFPTTKTQTLLEANYEQGDLQTYIIHLNKPEDEIGVQLHDLDSWYKSYLPITITSSDQQSRMVHSYQNVVTGFAMKLTGEAAQAMEDKDGVLLIHPERTLSLHTTHSPQFLGLHEGSGLWNQADLGNSVIIGVLDTGITPKHPSFSDEGMPPPPKKWRGKCEFKQGSCNNKLIGARNLQHTGTNARLQMPPFDENGHGTHTSSTAAGNFVKNANVLGNANGTAVGIAPKAHPAIYKVCTQGGCGERDILAAIDAAIDDGVAVLSLSFGGSPVGSFVNDAVAIGAFRAVQKGILVSCSAGNIGPFNKTVTNTAPWVLTVGASTIDRDIAAIARLENGEEFAGQSLFRPANFNSTFLPLFHAGAAKGAGAPAAYCGKGTLKDVDVRGKVCAREVGGDQELLKGKRF